MCTSNMSKQCRRRGGGVGGGGGGGGGNRGNRGSLPRAPSVRGPPNSAQLVQILAVSDRKVRQTGPQLYSSGLHSNYVR